MACDTVLMNNTTGCVHHEDVASRVGELAASRRDDSVLVGEGSDGQTNGLQRHDESGHCEDQQAKHPAVDRRKMCPVRRGVRMSQSKLFVRLPSSLKRHGPFMVFKFVLQNHVNQYKL